MNRSDIQERTSGDRLVQNGLTWAVVMALQASCTGEHSRDGGDMTPGAGLSAGLDTRGSDDAGSEMEPAGTSSTTTSGAEAGESSPPNGTTTNPKFDLGEGTAGPDPDPDAPPPGCGGTSTSDIEFSYIWIGNSGQGTVSKIDTRTVVEEARYVVSPTFSGNPVYGGPSRTSVNLYGDVVVVDRDGGATKFAARKSDCVDRNGNGAIDTSSGPTDVLAFGADECMLWRTALPLGSRPAAWTADVRHEADGTCIRTDAHVWTAAPSPTVLGAGIAYLLDGNDGSIQLEIQIPDCRCPVFGLYGAAVDPDNDVYMHAQDGTALGYGPLFHIRQDGTYDVIPFPPGARPGYGIMVDSEGNPWLAGWQNDLYQYKVGSGMWKRIDTGTLVAPYSALTYTLRGVQQDAAGDVWVAMADNYPDNLMGSPNAALLRVDGTLGVVTEAIGTDRLPLSLPSGVSIDVDQYVWIVDTTTNQALRVDPTNNYAYQAAAGLVRPYTYSDMTGFGLANVVGPPAD